MLCCVGLIGGMAVGQYLGGSWTLIGPAAGFGLGFVGDMKLMKGLHKRADQQPAVPQSKQDPDPVCGMEVDKNKVEHRAEHNGKTYYFCADGCKKAFEENPEKYLTKLQTA